MSQTNRLTDVGQTHRQMDTLTDVGHTHGRVDTLTTNRRWTGHTHTRTHIALYIYRFQSTFSIYKPLGVYLSVDKEH